MIELASDNQRPQYHFLPPSNWMNDPNGLIQWKGEYHFFYQHNPVRPVWEYNSIHWGHAVSSDLLHWRHLPIALSPTPDGPDAGGCWSGCAVNDADVPTILYTGYREGRQTQCLAVSHDGLLTWTKCSDNPLLAEQPAHTKPGEFRDPYVWQENDGWCMVLGSAWQNDRGLILLYRSPDLRSWTYVGPLLSASQTEQNVVWECPNFFTLGDKHLLIYSVYPKINVRYVIGRFDGQHFVPEREGQLGVDGTYYAPLSFQDNTGRRVMFGWIDESRALPAGTCWAGLASLPRILNLDVNGDLTVTPAPELRALRAQPLGEHGQEISGDTVEVIADFALSGSATCGLVVRESPGGEERTTIVYDPSLGALLIDRSQSSSAQGVDRSLQQTPVSLRQANRVRLHVFVDRSVLEVFVDDRICATARIYPERADSLRVRALVHGEATLMRLDAWELQLWQESV